MKSGEREKPESGRSGIWRASVPAIAASVSLPSPKRRSRPRLAQLGGWRWKPPAPIAACLLAILLFVQASALPVHFGLLMLPAHAGAMTKGCEKGSCCTALCYLDKHGIHHCVHMPGDSCECSVSTGDVEANPVFLCAILTLTETGDLLPDLIRAGQIFPKPSLVTGRIPATPSPPPK